MPSLNIQQLVNGWKPTDLYNFSKKMQNLTGQPQQCWFKLAGGPWPKDSAKALVT